MTLSTKPDARTALQELLGEIGQRQMYIPTAVLLRCRAALSAPSEEGIPREREELIARAPFVLMLPAGQQWMRDVIAVLRSP